MADGTYQRTCRKCQRAWLVPAAIAEERPDLRAATSRMITQIGASFDQQIALRQHYQQMGAAARCPQCGATSWTQERVADEPAAATPAAPIPATSEAPAGPPPPPPPPISAPGWASTATSQVEASASPSAGQTQGFVLDHAQTFVLNQALVSLTGDAWIEDGSGNRMFAVDGSLLTLRGTHVLKDLSGHPLYEVSKPLTPHMHKTMSISRGGHQVASVQEALFNLTGDKFKVSLAAGGELAVRGDWINREFQVADRSGQLVMTASRAWFTIHDAYGIQIAPGFEAPLGLAIAIALERVEGEEYGRNSPIQDLFGGLGPF